MPLDYHFSCSESPVIRCTYSYILAQLLFIQIDFEHVKVSRPPITRARMTQTRHMPYEFGVGAAGHQLRKETRCLIVTYWHRMPFVFCLSNLFPFFRRLNWLKHFGQPNESTSVGPDSWRPSNGMHECNLHRNHDHRRLPHLPCLPH